MDGDGFDLNDPGDWEHAICIIGWNPDHNSFIYYDPAEVLIKIHLILQLSILVDFQLLA